MKIDFMQKHLFFYLLGAYSLLALLGTACQTPSTNNTATVVGEVYEVNYNEKGEPITAAGYPYEHHVANEGQRPVVGDRVSYHERIYQNDSVIYSTFLQNRPITSVLPSLDQLPRPIPPDYDALLLMAVGDSLTVYQDLDSFDVNSLPNGVTNEDQFIYHIKMVNIVEKNIVDQEIATLKAREQSVRDSVADYVQRFGSGALASELKTSKAGVEVLTLREGTGRKAESGNFVTVHYSGFLKDLTNFDNSFKEAFPFTFRLDRGRVIMCWDDAIQNMAVGEQAILFIPYTLAYGVAGSAPKIPEKADLVFYVEILDVY